jgi:acyl carrier protein
MREILLKILVELTKKSEDTILKSTSWSDLDMDSLDTVELVMRMEEDYDIEITDAEASDIKSFADLLALVESKQSK